MGEPTCPHHHRHSARRTQSVTRSFSVAKHASMCRYPLQCARLVSHEPVYSPIACFPRFSFLGINDHHTASHTWYVPPEWHKSLKIAPASGRFAPDLASFLLLPILTTLDQQKPLPLIHPNVQPDRSRSRVAIDQVGLHRGAKRLRKMSERQRAPRAQTSHEVGRGA